ncbi:hypothetical protein STEG23_006365 [Scotinomys teguina]
MPVDWGFDEITNSSPIFSAPAPKSSAWGPTVPRKTFPNTGRVPFPKNFLQICKKILCRLFRVFVHVYIHHFDRVIVMGAEAHVNTCYKHFYYFVTEMNLIDRKELEPLGLGKEKQFDSCISYEYLFSSLRWKPHTVTSCMMLYSIDSVRHIGKDTRACVSLASAAVDTSRGRGESIASPSRGHTGMAARHLELLSTAPTTGTVRRHSSALEGEVSRTPRTAARDSSSALKVSWTPGNFLTFQGSQAWNCFSRKGILTVQENQA